MELIAYLDRSELSAPRRVQAVAGLVSTETGWNALDQRWRSALSKRGLDRFHKTDFETRQAEFSQLSNPDRIGLLQDLIGTIADWGLLVVAFGINLDDFFALDDVDQRRIGPPFVLCATGAVIEAAEWLNALPPEADWDRLRDARVKFRFEAGDEGADRVQQILETPSATGSFGRRISGVEFDTKTCRSFEVADFLAYETAKQVLRTIGSESRPRP